MATRILASENGVCFYDSVTEAVFGVLLESLEEAELFEEYVNKDLRKLTHDEFVKRLSEFREESKHCVCGNEIKQYEEGDDTMTTCEECR